MAYDEKLAQRLNNLIKDRSDVFGRKMFGGVGYLLRGNMCFGIYKEFLVLRMGEENAKKALENKNTKPFDITGRVMKGWVMVSPEGIKKDSELKRWIQQAVDFVETLPRK